MSPRTILLALGCLLAAVLAARPAAADVATITLHEDQRRLESTGRFDLFRDVDARLTIDEVAALPDARWQRASQPNPNYGFTGDAIWLRVRLDNPAAVDATRMLVFRYPLLDRVELYVVEPGGGYGRTVNGDRLPYAQRPFDTHYVMFELRVPAQQARTAYLRVRTDSSTQVAFDLMTPDRLRQHETDTLFVHGAYYGLMLALGVYNFFLFLSIRTRAYFWYVAYVFVFTATQMGLDGTAGRYLFPEHPGAANVFTPLTIALLVMPTLRFTQDFLDTRRHLPRTHRVLTAFVLGNTGSVLLALFASYSLAIRVATVLAILCCVGCAVVGVVVLRLRYRPARFYALAFGTVLVGTILYAFMAFGLVPANVFFSNIQRIGSALEVVLLSFALGDHISTINAERDAARTAAIELERDLAVTGTVQRLFLPRQDAFAGPGLALRGFYAPASQCGGDWWWYEPTDAGRVRILLGDVTGHGVGAAMVTAGIAAAYRALPEATRRGDMHAVMAALNANVSDICAGAHHMTLGALEVDPGAGEVRLWSAGAPAALVLRHDGRIEQLVARGLPLGTPDLEVGHARAAIAPGDRLFVFSDGLHELVLAGGRQLGYAGVARMLRRTLGRSGDDAYRELARELQAAVAKAPQLDDIAFVLIDVTERIPAQQAA